MSPGRIFSASTALALVALLPVAAAAQGTSGAPPAPLAAQGCLGCHGPGGKGAGGAPAIAGRDRAELAAAMAAFRANERPATIMNRIARGYTDAEVAAMADHFAAVR